MELSIGFDRDFTGSALTWNKGKNPARGRVVALDPMVSPGCRLRLHFDVLDSQNICKVHLFWLRKTSILTADYIFGFERSVFRHNYSI